MKTIIVPYAVLAALGLFLISTDVLSQTKDSATEQERTHVTEIHTAEGTVEIHWGQPDLKISGAAPSFDQLDTNHDEVISMEEAQAYLPLLNEFDYADHNRNGSISKKEYQQWQ